MNHNLASQQRITRRRQESFGEASALHHSRFENDNGRVPQLEHARRYAEHWDELCEKNLGLLFWGKPGNGKTFAAACIANALLQKDDMHVPIVKMTTFGVILNKLPTMPALDKELYI